MAQKEIELLKKQIEKLDQKDFDLEAWKNYTNIILGRIFGENSQKIDQIRKIEYEHSSWSLRDTSGTSAIQACKDMGKEILNASIAELETFGVPKTGTESSEEIIMIIKEALQDELKGSQYKELLGIMHSREKPEEKQVLIADKIKSYDSDAANHVLGRILSNKKVEKEL
ncbi:MAG: hypothetical protein K9G58_04690 [Bacteroidales bacterium]|nr:hypothetical protein [Bacteroidales bacterium]MCF8386942.1 hypothetical protein [Bacteroidales bacterium]MCF8397443.1 hypothetical protein [Bacteroidales bacterium]